MSLDLGTVFGFLELDEAPFTDALDGSEGKLKDFAGRGAKIAAAAGVGIGLAVAAGVLGEMNIEAANDKLAAQLDLSVAESERIGAVAGSVYAGAYGDSLDEVNQAIRGLVQNVSGMADASSADLQRVTQKTLDLVTAFEQDLPMATAAAGQLIRNGLAKDADAAFDLITKGLQSPANKADDLLETFNEYSTMFRELKLSGVDALGLINQGLTAGARDADTVADALKEFAIRAQDGSDTSAAGFKAIGLSATEMTEAVAKGGPRARAALDKVLDGLRRIEDPAKRNAAAVALFGTKAEDLGDALFALDLDTAADEMGQVEGAAARMGTTLNDNATVNIESFKRQAQAAFVDLLGGKVLPYVNETAQVLATEFGPTMRDDVLPTLRTLGELLGPVVGGLGDLARFIGQLPGPLQIAALGFLAAGAGARRATPMIDGFTTRIKDARVAAGGKLGLRGTLGGLTSFIAGGPWGLAFAAGVGILGGFIAKQEEAKARTDELVASLDEQTGAVTKLTRANVAKTLQDQGVFTAARALGLSLRDVTDAALGNAAANERVQAAVQSSTRGFDLASGTWRDANGVAHELTGTQADLVNKVHKVTAAIGSQSGEVADARREWFELNEATGAAAEGGNKLGRQLARGFAAGIRENTDIPVAAARGMVNKVKANADDLLEVRSPSRWAWRLASMVTKGFAGGLIDTTDVAVGAVRDMAQRAVDELTTRLDKVTTKLGDLKSDAQNIRSSVGDQVRGILDLGALGGSPVGAGNALAGMAARASSWVNLLDKLEATNIDDDLVARIAEAGPESGMAAAMSLSRATRAQGRGINASYAQIEGAAGRAGNLIADAQFGRQIRHYERVEDKLDRMLHELKAANRRAGRGSGALALAAS